LEQEVQGLYLLLPHLAVLILQVVVLVPQLAAEVGVITLIPTLQVLAAAVTAVQVAAVQVAAALEDRELQGKDLAAATVVPHHLAAVVVQLVLVQLAHPQL
jgi:hypothetical protein